MKKYAKEVGNANTANATVVKVVSGLFIVIFPPLNLHPPTFIHNGSLNTTGSP